MRGSSSKHRAAFVAFSGQSSRAMLTVRVPRCATAKPNIPSVSRRLSTKIKQLTMLAWNRMITKQFVKWKSWIGCGSRRTTGRFCYLTTVVGAAVRGKHYFGG